MAENKRLVADIARKYQEAVDWNVKHKVGNIKMYYTGVLLLELSHCSYSVPTYLCSLVCTGVF